MTWKIATYALLLCGICALVYSGYILHRITRYLSLAHPDTFRQLGRPSIRTPARWPSNALRNFVGSGEYMALSDSTLELLCRQFKISIRVTYIFAGAAFIGVFAEAFSRAA